EDVKTRNIYTLDTKLSRKELKLATDELFTNPVIQESRINKSLERDKFDYSIAVSFKPGVTDNVGRTAKSALEDMLNKNLNNNEHVSAAMQYMLRGVTRVEAETIARDLLANNLIENASVQSYSNWKSDGISIPSSIMTSDHKPQFKEIDLDVNDKDLERISSEGILALNLNEMKTIRNYFKRPDIIKQREKVGLGDKPTDVELEATAASWSEHCHHKIFNGLIDYTDPKSRTMTIDSLFDTYIKQVTDELAYPWLLSVFKDNAGVIQFNDKRALVYKVETHNSPSALDPFGGAMTGIVGVNRDPFGTGMGSKLIANVWGYCLGNPNFKGKMPGGLLHPRRIRDGVHKGVIEGGNQSGIPYMRGWETFDDRYAGKPLVFCGTLGEMPLALHGNPAYEKDVKSGDLIVMVGGRVGKDGIHGATFSSEELHKDSPIQAVQIGDPITQKKMTDMLLEARDLGLYRGITDNGAAGLNSSVGEMALFSGGCDMDLAKVPLKYQGLESWEKLVSEAQERMTIAVPVDKIQKYMELSTKRKVESTVLGEFTNDGIFHIKEGEETVAYMDMDFLHNGDPRYELEATFIKQKFSTPRIKIDNHYQVLTDMLKRLNICSGEKRCRQYDHEVKGRSIIKPFVGREFDVPSDATVMLAEYGGVEGIILAEGINPFFSDIDTYWMAASVVDEAVRKFISIGGKLGSESRLSGLDNFCWPNCVKESMPKRSHKLAQLVRANQGLYTFCREYGIPLISGKDSMSNDCTKVDPPISVPPTLLFSIVAKMPDISKAVTMDIKEPGDLVYVIGQTKNELGASEFYRHHGEMTRGRPYVGNIVPKVNADQAKKYYNALSMAIDDGIVKSCHTPTKGGLGAALAKTSFAGNLGMDIYLKYVPGSVRTDYGTLYSESNSRFIVTISPEQQDYFEEVMEIGIKSGIDFAEVGFVRDDKQFNIYCRDNNLIISDDINEMKKEWKSTLDEVD
ncbi:MAG: AIR synthase-related protein, partial [Nanoarchaeota archaeon]|nr:AIR synthase-related protein [Nanoarchaeota archaeon]